jgi:hypothetical protein
LFFLRYCEFIWVWLWFTWRTAAAEDTSLTFDGNRRSFEISKKEIDPLLDVCFLSTIELSWAKSIAKYIVGTCYTLVRQTEPWEIKEK